MVDCVFLSCFDHDVLFFASLLGQAHIRVHHASTLELADFLLLATGATVLLTDATFLDGSWVEALALARKFHPLAATLLCADSSDRKFIASAGELGALDVLWRPVGVERLRASIWTAHQIAMERHRWQSELLHHEGRRFRSHRTPA
jgi:DNA-binding NtrC family response regulator